jgi:3-hydroxyisobutyrate dehydrogenase
LGAHVAATSEEAIRRSDVVIVMLWDFQSVKETLNPEKAGLLKGKIVIQMSTISPDENLVSVKILCVFRFPYLFY